jgi:hypothetical protein
MRIALLGCLAALPAAAQGYYRAPPYGYATLPAYGYAQPAPDAWAPARRWCMDPSIGGMVPTLHWSAGNADGLAGADHAVEGLNGQGDLA